MTQKFGTATNGTSTAPVTDKANPGRDMDLDLCRGGDGRAVPIHTHNSDGSGSPWTVERRSRREVHRR